MWRHMLGAYDTPVNVWISHEPQARFEPTGGERWPQVTVNEVTRFPETLFETLNTDDNCWVSTDGWSMDVFLTLRGVEDLSFWFIRVDEAGVRSAFFTDFEFERGSPDFEALFDTCDATQTQQTRLAELANVLLGDAAVYARDHRFDDTFVFGPYEASVNEFQIGAMTPLAYSSMYLRQVPSELRNEILQIAGTACGVE